MDKQETIESMKHKVAKAIAFQAGSLDLQQQEMAELCGIHKSQLSRIVKGHIDNVSLQALIAIASNMDIAVELKVKF